MWLHEENSLLASANPVKFRILSKIDPGEIQGVIEFHRFLQARAALDSSLLTVSVERNNQAIKL